VSGKVVVEDFVITAPSSTVLVTQLLPEFGVSLIKGKVFNRTDHNVMGKVGFIDSVKDRPIDAVYGYSFIKNTSGTFDLKPVFLRGKIAPGMHYLTVYHSNVTEGFEEELGKFSINVLEEAAPTTGIIDGRVKDTKGVNLLGVKVTAGNRTGLTTNTGLYRISEVPPGSFIVTASLNGYETQTKGKEVFPGEISIVDFILKKIEEPPPEEEPTTAKWMDRYKELLGLAAVPMISVFNYFGTMYDFALDKAAVIYAETAGIPVSEAKDQLLLIDTLGSFAIFGLTSPKGLTKAGLTAAAAKSTAEASLGKSATEIIRLGAENPKTLAKIFLALPETARKTLFTNLGKSATGRIALVTLQKAVGKNPALSAKILNIGLAKGAIATLVGSTGFLMFVGFIKEEALQQFNMAMFNLIAAKDWEAADEMYSTYKAGVDSIIAAYNGVFAIPILGDLMKAVYGSTAESANLQTLAFRKQIDAGLGIVVVPTTLTVETNVDPAEIEIVGIDATFVSPFTTELEPETYGIVASKKGYYPKTAQAFVDKGIANLVTIALTAIKEEVDPNMGHLQVEIRDRKTGATVKANLYINDVVEKYHLSTHPVDLKPGIYNLRIEEFGYEPQEDTVSVEKGVRTIIKVELDKIPEEPKEPFVPYEPPPKIPYIEPTVGRLELTSTPTASVWITGEEVSPATPDVIELEQGYYDVVFKAEGYKEWKKNTLIKTGELSRLSVSLVAIEEPEPTRLLAKVNVNTNPTGAKILINGEWTNKYTPDSVLLEPGQYELSLTKTGYIQAFVPLNLSEG